MQRERVLPVLSDGRREIGAFHAGVADVVGGRGHVPVGAHLVVASTVGCVPPVAT